MIYVDDHCHLMHAKYVDLQATIERAKKAGIKKIICSGTNPETNRQALEIAAKYPELIKVSAGIYPVDALGIGPDVEEGLTVHKGPIDLDNEFEFIKKNKDKITAIGEVGLDYHWIKDDKLRAKERENFTKIIEFVEKLKKPMIVHTRAAEQDCIEMLTSSKLKKVILHCFEGNKALVKRASDAGYIFSIPTNIVRSKHFQQLAKDVNINQITTETDGPYLSPVPGTTNEPANIPLAVKKIAEIKQFTEEETANNIWLNFQKIYD